MKTSISDYYEFEKSISDDELVFIFGTGISSALTGERYGWKKWIEDGINYFTDRDTASVLAKSLENDSSAENMINVAGRVIDQAKAEGFYAKWMHSSFETAQITNEQLADTLRTIARTGDVFVTTNYDLLLERATGLNYLSYAQPDAAFAMLDERKSEAVIHIHGIYDSVHDVDNIVADNDQYRNVLDDKGAQFIQNLLGTRTLVFVGCGSTTDDINISQFIRFAWEHLKLDKHYYFLCNSSSAVPKMPDNIRLIPYGDNYDDLPKFLEEMAQFRLRKKLLNSSLVGRTAYDSYPATGDELLRYHYSQRAIPFCGRTEELKELLDFLNHDACFRWWVITGSAGSGKSRLAFELLYSLPTTWFGFFLKDGVSEEDINNYNPASDNVVVIDYVAGRERSIAKIIQGLKSRFINHKLRVLLLERDHNKATGSWYSKLLQGFSREDRQMIKNSLYGEFLDLNSFEAEEAEQLINAVLLYHGKNIIIGQEILKGYKAALNPLYLQMYTEAWIAEEFEIPKYDSVTALLESLLKREQERWLSIFEYRQDVCNSFVRLLVRANISGYIKTDDIPDYYKNDWKIVRDYISTQTFSGTQREELRDSLISIVCQNVETKHAIISPEYPDIIKEYMFCYYSDRDELPSLMEEVWQNIPQEFSMFIHKCLMDFDDQPFFKEALNVYNDTVPNHKALLGRLNLLESRPIQPGEDPLVYLDIIENERQFWSDLIIPEGRETEVAIFKVLGLGNVAKQIGAWSMFDVSEMLSCIDEMLAVPGDKEIKVVKKTLLQELITNLNRHSFFKEAELLREKLDNLMNLESGDEYDARLLMHGYNERMIKAGIEGKWDKARKILHEMENNCSVDYLSSAHVLAHSCAGLEQLSMQSEYNDVFGDGLHILKSLESRYPNDQIIRARRIENEATILTKHFFGGRFTKDQIRSELKPLEKEIAYFQFQEPNCEDNQEINNAFSEAWSAVMALKLNFASIKELEDIEKEAEGILSGHAGLAEIAYVRICATTELYEYHLYKKVPHEIVEKLYKHVTDNPDSAVVREAFFNMLEKSEDVGRNADYYSLDIIRGALQDARYNPLMGSGIDEIDLYERLIEEAVISSQEPDRKEFKIGRNDPCPCGSGKKFKKCCLGKGIYD